MAFDIIGAKRAGYSDTEIADYLAQQTGFDAAGARGAGYSDQEIIGHVSGQVDVGADKPKEKSSLVRRAVGDTAISALKGAIGLPESVVGLADIATGGRVGKALETVGYRPKEAKQILDTMYSPEQQEANAAVQQAQGFVPTLKAAVENPSTIFHSAVESAPSMIGAGGIARGGMKILPKLSPVIAGALGEGAMSAGSTAEQTRQDSPDGTLTPTQSAISLGSGALTSGLGTVGGKVAQRLGITDIDSFLASGAPIESKKAVTRAIIEGAISEGVLEEMPQSAQEQAAQNLATGRPIGEGVGNATAMGGITGGVMGGGGNVIANTSPAPAGPLSRAVGMADTRAVAPVQPIGELVAERRGMNAQPQPVTMSAPVEQPVAQPEPVAVEQPPVAVEQPVPVSRAAAPASSLSSLISQARNRVPTLPASGVEGATNEGQRNDEGQGYDEGKSYADAEGNGQNAQAGLPPRGDGADAEDKRGVAANLPESRQNTDAQISPVAGLSEPVDTQVSHEKGAEGADAPTIAPDAATVDPAPNGPTNSLAGPPASWIIRDKTTGYPVFETFDKSLEGNINREKYEMVPALQHLQETNARIKAGNPPEAPSPSPPSPKVEAPAPVGEDNTEQEAIAAMREGRVFLSRDGKTFMLSEEGGGGYKPSGKLKKAPWDKSIRAKYHDFRALYEAAKEATPVGDTAANSEEMAAPAAEPWQIPLAQFRELQKKVRRPSANKGPLAGNFEFVMPDGSKRVYENINYNKEGAIRDFHRKEIQQAIQLGREVPAAVLAEYPDLAPRQYSTNDNAPRADLTLERVRSSFPTLPVTEDNGTFTVTTPSGIPIRISKVGEIEFGPEQRAAAEKEYGRKLRPDERPSAEFRPLDHGAIINLTERGISELSHESFHAAMNLALTERQKAAVLRTFGNEEKAAAEYQRLKESGALEGKRGNYWLSKIYRFLRALKQLISPTAKGVMEDVASGKVWGKAHAGDGGARYAAQGQTDTPAFKRWFGGSKVVDAEGKPLVVYHGTGEDINIFDPERTPTTDDGWLGAGIYLTASQFTAQVYAENNSKGAEHGKVMSLYAKVENPYISKKQAPTQGMTRDEVVKWTENIKAQGYDGIVFHADHWNDGIGVRFQEIVVFSPTQIKSATDNNGDFNPANPDIRYSLRSAFTGHNPAALKSALTFHPKVQALVGSVFNNGRNVSPWMRTVGTMYHMAEKLAAEGKPEFKRVFDKGQEFLTDISTLALKAEAAAPDIFPKMGTGKGIFHTLPRKDAKAIAEPLYQGTLYGGADPKKGKVFSDLELKRIFHLSDHQIDLYRQARAATDQSLDDMAKSLIARNAKEAKVGFDRDLDLADMAAEVKSAIEDKVADMKAALDQAESDFKATPPDPDAKAQKKAEKAHQSFVNKQEAAIELHELLIANVDDLAHKTDTLKKRGYFPLMRFGQYTVTMKDRDGKVQFFGLYESAYKARLMADALAKENADHTVTQAVMGREKFKLFAGMNLEALQLFADHIKAEDSEAYQEYLKQAMNNRSSMKRLIHRKGTEGYSEDAVRTLASFITSNARHASTQYHLHDMQKLATEIPDGTQGDVQDQAVKLYEYLSKPAEEASKLRGYLFFHYLGGSLASGIVNMTQPVMMTMPYLASKTTAAKAAKHLSKASKMSFTDPAKVGGELGVALRRAEAEGVTAPQEIYQLTAMASNKLLAANPYWNAGMKAWGGFFSVAEAFNRRVTFIASYRISREKGLTADRAYNEAVKAITETQGIYNKGNRPKWGRGMVGGTLFTFKQFSVMYLELFNRLPAKQKGIMLGILWLMAGLQGMPFAEDAEDIIDTIGQWAGFATNSKRWLNQTAEDTLGKDAGNFITQGISSVLPLDLQGRMGLQNLIPGTAILKQSETDKGRDVKEFFGPAGGLLASLGDALTLAATGMPGRALLAASPRAVQNYAQGAETIATGAAHDKFGRKTVELSPAEAAMKFTGFNPSRMAEESQVKSANHQDVNLLRVRKQEIVNQWAYGIANKDRGEIAEAKRKLVEWNKKNPELKMTLGSVVQSARQKSRALQTTGKERFIKSMPKEIRKRVIDELG